MYVDIAEWKRGRIIVKLRARTWERAGEALAWLRANPPAGYRIEEVTLLPTTSSGRRCDVTVSLGYVDDREPLITSVGDAKAQPSLILFAAMARSREGLLSSPETASPTP